MHVCVCVCLEIIPARGFSIVTAVFRNRCNIGSVTSSRVDGCRNLSPQSILLTVPSNFTLSQLHTAIPFFNTIALVMFISGTCTILYFYFFTRFFPLFFKVCELCVFCATSMQPMPLI